MSENERNEPLLIRADRVITPDGTIEPGAILVSGHRIDAVSRHIEPPPGADVIDLPGLTLVPGFIDVHVHGGGGFPLITSNPEEVRSYASWAPSRGVTAFLATIVSRTPADAMPAIRAAAEVAGAPADGAEVLGLNLEGPFVSPGRRGALPASWVTAPDAGAFRRLLESCANRLRLMTVAPEITGALDLIKAATEAGVRVSLGHTDAGYDVALQGFRTGASHVTHAFNAMRSLHHRDPGVIGAALDSPGVTIEVIADGVHLHPATVRLLVTAFGPGRVALVTDAVTPAGLETGVFRLGGEEARLESGRVTLPDGTIAGSAATMDSVVANVVCWGIATLAEASQMASAVPAHVAGVAGRKGRLAPGYDADIVALSDDFRVSATWVRGRLAHGRPAGATG